MEGIVRDYFRRLDSFLISLHAIEEGREAHNGQEGEFFFLVPKEVHLEKAEELKHHAIPVESFFARVKQTLAAPEIHSNVKHYLTLFFDRIKLQMEQVAGSFYHCSNSQLFSGDTYLPEDVTAIPSRNLVRMHITNLKSVAMDRAPKDQMLCVDFNATRAFLESEPSYDGDFWEEDTRFNAVPLADFVASDLTDDEKNKSGLGFTAGDLVFRKITLNDQTFFMWIPSFLRLIYFLKSFEHEETGAFPCVVVTEDVRLFGLRGYAESATHGQKQGSFILVARDDFPQWQNQQLSVPISTAVKEPVRSHLSSCHDVSTFSQSQWEDAFWKGTLSLTLLESMLFTIEGLSVQIRAKHWQFDCSLWISEDSPWNNFVQAWNTVLENRETILLSKNNTILNSKWQNIKFSTLKWLPIFRIVTNFAEWSWQLDDARCNIPQILIQDMKNRSRLVPLTENFSVPADPRAVFRVSNRLERIIELLPFPNNRLMRKGLLLPPELNQYMWIVRMNGRFLSTDLLSRMQIMLNRYNRNDIVLQDEESEENREEDEESSDSGVTTAALLRLVNGVSPIQPVQDSPDGQEEEEINRGAAPLHPNPFVTFTTPQWLSTRDEETRPRPPIHRRNLLQAFDNEEEEEEEEEQRNHEVLVPSFEDSLREDQEVGEDQIEPEEEKSSGSPPLVSLEVSPRRLGQLPPAEEKEDVNNDDNGGSSSDSTESSNLVSESSNSSTQSTASTENETSSLMHVSLNDAEKDESDEDESDEDE